MFHKRLLKNLPLLVVAAALALSGCQTAPKPVTDLASKPTPFEFDVRGVGVIPTAVVEKVAVDNSTASVDPTPVGGAPLVDAQLYQNDADGYSLEVPKEYEIDVANAVETMILAPGAGEPGDSRAAAFIFVEPAKGRTAEQAIEAIKIEIGPGFDITIDPAITVDGAQALVVSGLPAQDTSRQLFMVHNDVLYRIMFLPNNPQVAAYPQMEKLYAMVVNTFRFTQGYEPAWQKYINKLAGFSISYPADWQEQNLPDENQGQLHHIALKGPEGGVELVWGTGLGGACPEDYQPLAVAKGNWPACHTKKIDGTELWSLAGRPIGNTNFAGFVFTNDTTPKSHDVVLQVLSTLSFP